MFGISTFLIREYTCAWACFMVWLINPVSEEKFPFLHEMVSSAARLSVRGEEALGL